MQLKEKWEDFVWWHAKHSVKIDWLITGLVFLAVFVFVTGLVLTNLNDAHEFITTIW